jgi:thymidylate kinase
MIRSNQVLAFSQERERQCSRSLSYGGQLGTRDFLRTLFRLLEDTTIRYCVLHSWDQLPDELSNDLDLAVHPNDKHKLRLLLRSLREKGYTCFQRLNHSTNGHFFVFYWTEPSGLKTAAVDIVFDHRRSGRILATSEQMVESRERHGEFWIPSAQVEFGYLLAKKAWKGGASARQLRRLRELAEELGREEAERIAAKIFLRGRAGRAVQACLNKSIASDLRDARSQFRAVAWRRHPLQSLGYLAEECRRIVRRVLQPTGVLVTVLGPDGAGKSTVISGLCQTLPLGFWARNRVFHWRPQALFPKKDTGINTTPHAKPARGQLASAIYLCAFFLDHWFGYLSEVRPLLSRSHLVVFDRYFHDVLVDPQRYRYGGPMWLAKWLSLLAPQPDLVIILEASEHSILARKQELSAQEIRQQHRSYRQLQFAEAVKVIIDTDSGIERTVLLSSNHVAEFMAERLARRMSGWKEVFG